MIRSYRLASMGLLTLAGLGACHRREPQVKTTTTVRSRADTTTRTTVDTLALRRLDEERRRREEDERRRREEAARGLEQARNALLAKVYFDFDSDELSAQGRSTLDAKVAALQANPGVRIRIAGHCDSRGSDEYNLALGQRRAVIAKRYLTDRGIDPGRIDVVSFGEEQPEVEGENEAAWAQNRRDEFRIIAGGDALGVRR